MATLFLKDGVFWLNYVAKGRRYRVSTGTKNRKLAEVKLNEISVKIFKGDFTPKKPKTQNTSLPDFFNRFIEYCRNTYSIQNFQSDLSRIQTLQDFFARKKIKQLDQINPGIFEEFQTIVLNGRKPKTIKNYLSLLKTMLNYAVKWGVLGKNPIAAVKPPKVVKTFHFFSKEEINQILNKAEEPLKTAVVILVNTGMRRGELFNLRWRDVDLKNKKIRIWPYDGFVPKGKRPRSIPLNKTVLNSFKFLSKKNKKAEFAFRPYKSIHTIRRRFTIILSNLEMSGTLHDLRHTFASHLAMAGVPIPVIKELLGHSDISTTMIYSHLAPNLHQTAVDKLTF